MECLISVVNSMQQMLGSAEILDSIDHVYLISAEIGSVEIPDISRIATLSTVDELDKLPDISNRSAHL